MMMGSERVEVCLDGQEVSVAELVLFVLPQQLCPLLRVGIRHLQLKVAWETVHFGTDVETPEDSSSHEAMDEVDWVVDSGNYHASHQSVGHQMATIGVVAVRKADDVLDQKPDSPHDGSEGSIAAVGTDSG
jgi:hypothetical protein